MADWMDGEVDIKEQTLTNGQIFALLRMTTALQDLITLTAVTWVKKGVADGALDIAAEAWRELSEEEP